MSVLVRFNPASLTKEQYEESVRRLREAGYFPLPAPTITSALAPRGG